MKKILTFIVGITAFALPLSAQNDRPTFDLQGEVRLCVPETADNGNVIASMRAEFSESGTLTRLDGTDVTRENNSFVIERNDRGQIVRLESLAGDAIRISIYAYDEQGRLSEITNNYLNIDTDEEFFDLRVTRYYDERNLPVREVVSNEDGSERAVFTYTYTDLDNNGNWTRRTVSEPSMDMNDEPESREVSYDAPTAADADTDVYVDAGYNDDLMAAVAASKTTGRRISDFIVNMLIALAFIAMFAHCIYELYINKNAEKRIFVGSRPYLILTIVVTGIIALLRAILDDAIIQGICYFIFSVGAYYLGSHRKERQVIEKAREYAEKGIKTDNTHMTTKAIYSIFEIPASSKTYVTTYYDKLGRVIDEEHDGSEHIMLPAIAIVLLVVLAVFAPFIGLFNYVRYYLIHRK